MLGYRTSAFPEGSVIAFDWLEMTAVNGAFQEGARRQVDVMVKDSQRFAKGSSSAAIVSELSERGIV